MINTNNEPAPALSTQKPVLSLLCCSRNDHYMGNPVWRLQTALNYLGNSIQAVHREGEVEVLVTDWGSEVPLKEVLKLNPVAAKMVKFIIVPPAIAREIQGDSPFSEVYAFNTAARKSSGQYVGRIDQDTLVGTRFLNTFFELVEGKRALDVPMPKALMLSNRFWVPYRFASQCPSFWEVNQFMRFFGKRLDGEMFHLPEKFFLRSYVGIWMVHRDIWHECGGYNEKMKYYDWMETEMIVRLMQRDYKVVDLGRIVHYDFYHLEHYPAIKKETVFATRKSNPRIDLSNLPKDLEYSPSGEDWGLRKYPLDVTGYVQTNQNRWQEDFDLPRFKWLSFIMLMLKTAILISADNFYNWRRSIKKSLSGLLKSK